MRTNQEGYTIQERDRFKPHPTIYLRGAARCPICACSIMVRKVAGVNAKTLRALAVADHIKTLHAPEALR